MFWGRGNCNILSYIFYIIFSLTVCLMKEIISFQFIRTGDTFWTVNKRRSCSGPALQKLTFRYRTVLPLIFSPTTRPEQDTHSGLSVGHTKRKCHSSSSGYATGGTAFINDLSATKGKNTVSFVTAKRQYTSDINSFSRVFPIQTR